METNQTGNIIVVAGFIVGLLAHFNIGVSTQDVATVISGVFILIGVAKQAYEHNKVVAQANAIIASYSPESIKHI